jgi:hypothetical protein
MSTNRALLAEDQGGSMHKIFQTLAFIGPIAAAGASLGWAAFLYLIKREKYLARVELAQLDVEAKKQTFATL